MIMEEERENRRDSLWSQWRLCSCRKSSSSY